MADEVIHYRFRVRGGTAAALAARNEIPLVRELVVSTDTGRLKMGDGSTSYNQLPYLAETPRFGYLTANFDGGDDDIEVGASCELFVPFGFRPYRWTILADAVGQLSIDVRADSYATYPVASSITGGAPPAISGSNKAQAGPLTGWTTLQAPSALQFVVESCAGIRRATLILEVDRKWQE